MTLATRRFAWAVLVAAGAALALSAVVWPPELRHGAAAPATLLALAVLVLTELPLLPSSGRLLMSYEEAPLFVVFAIFNPPAAAAIAGLAKLVGHTVRRRRPIKTLFNGSKQVLAVLAGAMVAWPLGRGHPAGSSRQLLACLLGLVIFEVVSELLLGIVLTLTSGRQWWRRARESAGMTFLRVAAHGSVGAGALTLAFGPHSLVAPAFMMGPFAVVVLAERRYLRAQQCLQVNRAVNRLVNDLNTIPDLAGRALLLAEQAREMLRAESVSVFFPQAPGGPITITQANLDRAPRVLAELSGLDSSPHSPLALVRATGRPQLIQVTRDARAVADELASAGIRDVVIAPLPDSGGAIQATNRGGSEPFGEADLTQLTLIAHTAAGALASALSYSQERATALRLREVDRRRHEFVSSVAHEIRNPLTLIQGYAYTFRYHRDEMGAEQGDDFADKLMRNAEHLNQLVDHLLSLPRSPAPLGEDDHPVQVGHIAQAVVDDLAERGETRELVLELDDRAPEVFAAPYRLELVIRNLVGNAVKYSEGLVTIRVRAQTGSTVLEVTDSGPGIAPELHDAVFGRFYQIDGPPSSSKAGSGLGLYLVKSLVEGVGGSVELDSAPERGSTFRVRFPEPAQVLSFSNGHS